MYQNQNFWVLGLGFGSVFGFGVLGFGQFWVWFWDLGFGCSLDFNLVMENYSYPLVKLLGNCWPMDYHLCFTSSEKLSVTSWQYPSKTNLPNLSNKKPFIEIKPVFYKVSMKCLLVKESESKIDFFEFSITLFHKKTFFGKNRFSFKWVLSHKNLK